MTTTTSWRVRARRALRRAYERGLRDGRTAAREEVTRPEISVRLPYREQPEVDVEFYDDAGDLLGNGTATLEPKVNASGIILTARATYTGTRGARVARLVVWIGDVQRVGIARNPMQLAAGDTLVISFNVRVGLNPGGFWWGDDIDPDLPPPSPELVNEQSWRR